MALPPISGSTTPAQPIQPAGNPRAVAQKAFFDAALRRTEAPVAAAPVARQTSAPVTAAPVRTAIPVIDVNAEPPSRPLRPGSLLNIVV